MRFKGYYMQNDLNSTKKPAAFWNIIALLCTVHFVNDATQALLPAIYPLLQETYNLSLLQLGIITATFQMTGSLLQPLVGYYGDKKPFPLAMGTCFLFSFLGVITLAYTKTYYSFLAGSACIGLASALFHPESSRVCRFASNGRYGVAQSTFQIGGNLGTAVGPLLAALFIYKQTQIAYLIPFSLASAATLLFVTNWYIKNLNKAAICKANNVGNGLKKSKVITSLVILIILMFAKYVYLSTFQNYFTLYVIEKFNLSIEAGQIMLFLFLGGMALGTIFGGPLGDKFGAHMVIWFSILGVVPFSFILPYVGLIPTAILSTLIGIILASAFPAIVVYAQELIPGKVGTISGLMYGFAYGIGALSACVMGYIGDYIGLQKLFILSGYLPLLGILAILLPKVNS